MTSRNHSAMRKLSMVECQLCGSRQDLARHHIVPRSRAACDDLENLIVLCDTDHRRVHSHDVDLGVYLTPSQAAKSVLLLGTVWAAWELLYPSESPKRVTSGVSWPE